MIQPCLNEFRSSANILIIKDSLYVATLFYLFLAALGLHGRTQFFSSYAEWGLFSNCGVRASDCGGFSYCREHGF